MEERLTLLSTRNPLYCDIPEGKWVCCCHRLYCGDIGLVCEHNKSSNAKLMVTFLPQIPNKLTSSAPKCKRLMHPEPQIWCTYQAKMVWGKKIWKNSDKEYELNHKTYKVGLILKHLPPTSVTISDTPQDISPFLSAQFISCLLFFSSVVFHFAQDTIKVGHWAKVINGEQQGLIGHVIDISNDTLKVILHTNNETAPLLESVHALSNSYLPSAHVKYWYEYEYECGIISAVSEEDRMLTFMDP